MVTFIDAHRVTHGVEPICWQLPIAPAHLLRIQSAGAKP